MNGYPDQERENAQASSVSAGPAERIETAGVEPAHDAALEDWTPEASPVTRTEVPLEQPIAAPVFEHDVDPERPMFQQWYVPPPRPPVRIPHFGHLAILLVFVLSGLFAAGIAMGIAVRMHLFGVKSLQSAMTDLDIHYTLGSEVVVYLMMFVASLIFFPMIWHKG